MKKIFFLIFTITKLNATDFYPSLYFFNEKKIEIKKYEITEKYIELHGEKLIISREIINSNDEKIYIVINPEKLTTKIIMDTNFFEIDKFYFTNTLFFKLKNSYINNSNTIGETNQKAKLVKNKALILLTTDLCPTHTKLETNFYISLIKKEITNNLIIFFSGEWLDKHTNELIWIKQNYPNFIAGNHTYHHFIIKNNFPNESLKREIIDTELTMLKNGITPSCFFRFPGLKYQKENLSLLYEMNLIPLSVNFWSGQKVFPKKSILLVHSNGSVPIEVRMFIKFLKNLKENRFISPEEWFYK